MPKTYQLEDIKAAVQSVNAAKLTITQAAREYKVPRQTVSDHVHKEMKYTTGNDRMLNDEEEEALVGYCKYMASHGFPLSRKRARCYVIEIVKVSGRQTLFNMEKGPSDQWFRKFIERHPELSEKKAEKQDRSRNRMSNINVIDNFFDFFKKELHKLGDVSAECIFNCDETGWSGKESSREKVIGLRGKHTYQQQMFTSDHITAHLCVSAAGRFLPTMVIFEGSLPHREYKDGISGDWQFAISENGYMDRELFTVWFKRIFVPNCGRKRPVVLVMDNHSSHISIPVIELARKESITLIGLPAHTTHLLQPLDVGIIGPLKDKITSVATNLGFVNKSLVIGKSKMPIVLNHAIDQTTAFSVKEAFRKAGIHPVDRSAISQSQLIPASFSKNESVTSTEKGEQSKENTEEEEVENTTKPDKEKGQEETMKSLTCDKCGAFTGENPLVKQGLVPESLAKIMLPPPAGKVLTKKRKFVTEGRVISCEGMLEQLRLKEEEEKTKKENLIKKKKEREERLKEKEEKEKTKKEKVIQKKKEREDKLKAKEEEEKTKKEKALEKKKEREEALKAKEEERKKKTLKRKQQTKATTEEKKKRVPETTNTVPYADVIYTCGICEERALVTDDDVGIRWVGCDSAPQCLIGSGWFHFDCLPTDEQESVEESLSNSGVEWFCWECCRRFEE